MMYSILDYDNLWNSFTRRNTYTQSMYFKENKQIKIPRIYGRLQGNKGSSYHYGSSNLSKNKEERGRLTLAYTHM